MKTPEQIPGVKLIQLHTTHDPRGIFAKFPTISNFPVAEIFFTTSAAGVIRGLHAQAGPTPCRKLVYCAHGLALDVIVDLRQTSPTYRRHASMMLNARGPILSLPPGVAHGFCALTDRTVMAYATTAVHDPTFDLGVHWASIGFDWCHEADGVFRDFTISERDRNLPALKDFATPFR
jgi:dTDP-4-dehydrorhamnose 3,5-epimerase